jgi:ComF family protein
MPVASVWSRAYRAARRILTGTLDLVYPPCCLGCSARLERATDPLCGRCLRRMERVAPADLADRLARRPEAERVIDYAFVLWMYDRTGTLQAVQHALKYYNRPYYGVALGRLLGTAYREGDGPVPDCLVPVPLHRARFLERGYNQSMMLARGLGDALSAPVDESLLVRPAATRTQTKLSRPDRWKNVQGAFAAPDPAALFGRSVLLVDDILTTGSTAGAGAQVLAEAGASAVYFAALSMARV